MQEGVILIQFELLHSRILSLKKTRSETGIVAHSFNPSTQEAEASRFKRVPGQPDSNNETLSRKNKETN